LLLQRDDERAWNGVVGVVSVAFAVCDSDPKRFWKPVEVVYRNLVTISVVV
jgi:hypothetical protein